MLGAIAAVGLTAFAAEPEAVQPISLGEVKSHEPWDGKFDVEYTLKGLAADVEYKVAFDVKAGGQTASVTNAAAKLANGTCTNTYDTAELFGATTTDKEAEITARLVKVEPVDYTRPVQLWENGPLFAQCNVGADTPEGYGILTNYNGSAQAVKDALGEGWRLPSDAELKILAGMNDGDKVCSNVWTTCNGVVGRQFFGMTSGYEDKSIFFPAAGCDFGCGRTGDKFGGYYWSSSIGIPGT